MKCNFCVCFPHENYLEMCILRQLLNGFNMGVSGKKVFQVLHGVEVLSQKGPRDISQIVLIPGWGGQSLARKCSSPGTLAK